MIYLTDDLTFTLSLTGDLFLLQETPTDNKQAINLLQTKEWRSCVQNPVATKILSKLLKRDVPLYRQDIFRINEGDMIVLFRHIVYRKVDKDNSKLHLQLLYKFHTSKVVIVLSPDTDDVKYFH